MAQKGAGKGTGVQQSTFSIENWEAKGEHGKGRERGDRSKEAKAKGEGKGGREGGTRKGKGGTREGTGGRTKGEWQGWHKREQGGRPGCNKAFFQ